MLLEIHISSVSLIVIDPLSVSESNIENITLFPNPSSENIYIKNLKGDELITMYDLLGRVVEILKMLKTTVKWLWISLL